MKIYLDTSALIPFLYGQLTEPTRFVQVERLFNAIEDGNDVSDGFRDSLLELLRFPLIVVPHLDRTEANRLRRRFTIVDPYDALHVACAIFHSCEAIVTYDSHFQTVTEVITVATPPGMLAQLPSSGDENQ